MHELGIVVHVAKSVLTIAEKNMLTKIDAVTLEIGEVSGVVPDYLTDCWKYYRKDYEILAESELKIEVLPAVTYCENCKMEYPTVEYGKTCPHCASGNTYLLTGNECMIKEIEAY